MSSSRDERDRRVLQNAVDMGYVLKWEHLEGERSARVYVVESDNEMI